VTLRIAPEARRVIDTWLSADKSRPALRLSFAGGCGALGFRLTPAALGSRQGERVIDVDGLTFYVDFKASADLDGARLELGEGEDDVVVVHEDAVVGGMC
jgi:Fe-S cluster assembly iron-binding protein IscA